MTINAALGNVFCVTASDDFMLMNPLNLVKCGQPLVLIVKQVYGVSHSISFDSIFRFGAEVTEEVVVLTTTEEASDLIGFIVMPDGTVAVVSFVSGYPA